MSSYLQRLAGSVIRPQEAIRPLLGSVYSDQARREPAEELFRGDEISASSQVSALSHLRSTQEHRLGETPTSPNEIVAAPHQKPHPASHVAPAIQPLMPTTLPFNPVSTGQGEEDKLPPAKISEQRAEVYITLLATSPAATINQSTAADSSNFISPRIREKRPAITSRAAEREPDEIQIHIGRIEISAVPQVPVTTVVRTPRTSSSLDEYLKRRDRRSQ
jgi:hypothetical protein